MGIVGVLTLRKKSDIIFKYEKNLTRPGLMQHFNDNTLKDIDRIGGSGLLLSLLLLLSEAPGSC